MATYKMMTKLNFKWRQEAMLSEFTCKIHKVMLLINIIKDQNKQISIVNTQEMRRCLKRRALVQDSRWSTKTLRE